MNGIQSICPQSVLSLEKQRVLVIGDCMLDAYLLGDSTRISPEAPVPVVRVECQRSVPGGAGNVARNIAALRGCVSLITIAGADREADTLEEVLRGESIDAFLIRSNTRPTTLKTRVLARGQQMIRLDREVNDALSQQEEEALMRQVRESLPGNDVVILSDYGKGIVSASFMKKFTALLLKQNPVPKLLIDPKPVNAAYYSGAYIMTPNAKEAGECVGFPVRSSEEVKQAGRILLDRFSCSNMLITLGAEGMALFSEGGKSIQHLPTSARDVFDVTGAGDTVIAVLGLALASGMNLSQACLLANRAAGLVVAQVGAAVVSPEDLIRELERNFRPDSSVW